MRCRQTQGKGRRAAVVNESGVDHCMFRVNSVNSTFDGFGQRYNVFVDPSVSQ
jgi:hypothetical protein